MGAPPLDTHTETNTTQGSHEQQQAPPPATMVSDSSSPGSAPQRGRACKHQNCERRGYDRCTWGQPQPPFSAILAAATSTMTPSRGGGSFRGGHGGGGRGGMNGQSGHVQSSQTHSSTAPAPAPAPASAPAAAGGSVVETIKKEDIGTQLQPQLKASDSATSSDEELGVSQASTKTQAQTGLVAQKPAQLSAAPSGEWSLDRFQPVRFGESPGPFQGLKNSQSVQTPQTPAITTSTSIGEPQTGTDKKNDIGKQPQPNAPNPAPATTTKASSFGGLSAKQDSSKAPEPSQNASQAASNTNTAVSNGDSGTVAVGAKELNNDHGGQTQPPGPPGLSVPACKTSFSTPGAQNGCDSAIETQPAKEPSQDEQSVQAAPGGAQAFSATAQSAEQFATRAQDTDKKNGSDTEPHQKGSAVAATSSSFAFGGSPGQAQPTFASGASPAPKTSFSSSPGLGAGRSSFSARFSRGATVGPESGPTTRNPITFGSTQPLYSPILCGVKGQGSSHARASEPPPALNESTGESQGPSRKRFKFDSTILVLVGVDEDEFTVHKHVIIRHSTYFDTQCSSNAQATEKCVRLPGLDPEVFDCYLQWVYHGEIVTLATENVDSILGVQEALWRSEGNSQALTKVGEVLSLAKLYMTASYLGDKKLKNATVDKFMDGSQVAFGDPGLTVTFINYLWSNSTPADNFRRAALKRGYMSTASPRMSNWLEENRDDLNTEFITELAIRLAKAKPMFDPENAPAGRCAYHDHDEETPPCA